MPAITDIKTCDNFRALGRTVFNFWVGACQSAYKQLNKEEIRHNPLNWDLAKFFGMDLDEVNLLFSESHSYSTRGGINMSRCYEQFIKNNGKFLGIKGFTDNDHLTYPRYREIKEGDDVLFRVLNFGFMFFEWENERYVFSIRERSYSEKPVFLLELIGKYEDSVRKLWNKVEDASAAEHYLRGKVYDFEKEEIINITNYSWNDVVFPPNLVESVRRHIDLVMGASGMLRKYNLNSKKGIIFEGPPGNGKTMLMKIIANQVDAGFIIVSPNCIDDASQVFKLARKITPVILLFEDIDLYAQAREANGRKSALGSLMNELDGVIENHEIIVFATTNSLAVVEGALQNRPGRFDRVYHIPNPGLSQRENLLRFFIKDLPNRITGRDIDDLARLTQGYSCAHIKEVVNTAFASVIFENLNEPVLDMRHFEEALESVTSGKKPVIGFQGHQLLS